MLLRFWTSRKCAVRLGELPIGRSIKIRIIGWPLLLFLCSIVVGVSADIATKPYDFPPKQQVISFLTETIDWYRHSSGERQAATEPSDLLFLKDNQAMGAQIVQLSFDYARTDAALAGEVPAVQEGIPATLDASTPDLQHFVGMERECEAEIRKTRDDLALLRKELQTARKADRRTLEAAAADTQSRLDLLQAQSTGLQSLVDFVRTTDDGEPLNTDLGSIIDDLSRTVPEVTTHGGTALPSPQNQNPSSVSKSRGSGILGLISDVSTRHRNLQTLDEAIRSTDRLAQSSRGLQMPLARFVKYALQSSDLGPRSLQARNLAVLRQQKTRLDSLTAQITNLSPAIVALDKQRILLGIYKSHLVSWRSSIANQYAAAWKKLVLHLLILASVVVLLVGFAEALHRFTVRYVHDANRRRMILIVQRIVLWLGIVLVTAFALASDLSSLATFLGLLTAGIAVALQNVILAVLGYLLLVGKLGIRVGDRVQISGVTGDLIDLGLLQFQVREIDTQEQPTGRVASFSNSFVFLSPATGMFRIGPSAKQPNK
jgi:hypothetical protein